MSYCPSSLILLGKYVQYFDYGQFMPEQQLLKQSDFFSLYKFAMVIASVSYAYIFS